MTAFFKRIFKGNIIYSAVLIVIGIVFAVWPESSRSTLVRLFGIALLLSGIAIGVTFFMKRSGRQLPVNLVAGVILAVIGILIIARPESFVEFLVILAGAFIMLSGVMNFCQTLTMATLHFPLWWVGMIISILTIVFSVLVITKPGRIADAVFIVTGVFMVFDGLSNLWIAFKLRSLSRHVREDVDAALGKRDDSFAPDELLDDLP